MRILQVVHGFPPYQIGGTENFTKELSIELSKNHKVCVFTGNACRGNLIYQETDEQYYNLQVRRTTIRIEDPNLRSPPDVSLNTYKNPVIEDKFRAYLRYTAPDVVHFQHTIGLSVSLIDIVSSSNIPIVLTLHDFWFLCPRIHLVKPDFTICEGPHSGINCSVCGVRGYSKNLVGAKIGNRIRHSEGLKEIKTMLSPTLKSYFKNLLFKFHSDATSQVFPYYLRFNYFHEMLSRANLIISPSLFLKNIYVRHGIEKAKIRIIPPGINPTFVHESKKSISPKLRIGYIGTVREHKGVEILIKTVRNFNSNKIELIIYGDGAPEYIHKLKSIASEVKWRGKYLPQEIGKVMQNIDLLVIPSLCPENAPLVAREALASKTPVIASKIGGLPEIIEDGVTGYLFDPGDIEGLKVKINEIVETPDLISKWKANMKPMKTIEEVAKEVENLYHEVCH